MRSIRARLLVLAAVWLTAALLAAFLFLSALLEDFVTDRFDAEAGALADALIASLEIESSGRIEVDDPPADPRLTLPLTGWYWQAEADGQVFARSASLLDGRLAGPGGEFTGGRGMGADGAALRVLRRELTIPDSDALIAITVTAPQQQIEESLRQIRGPLGLALIVLGLGLAAASVVQVTAGLRSLDRLGADLRQVRAGKAERLGLPDVSELRPLTTEINAALDQNATLLARSRQHLGNLAHSLKTPLAALANELPDGHAGHKLITRMDRLIGWHLRRARAASPRILGQRTPVAPVIGDIMLVLRWPMEDKGIRPLIDCPPDASFAGERQDLEEMIGNLAENAVKWGRSRLALRVTGGDGRLVIRIEDDGPGMAETDAPRALIRGARLDEQGPAGSGLGLAIVADLAALHGGELRLGRAEMGGLAAILDLPA
ncbi:sensor histidine kinase [Paracoccus siganidrum]|uniref:histidine kinase n=1 Tax=Paracoccus siganidrum TaxID=1276757 RepID=A0A418ZUZ1_9RHOB|nr:HAMP domain-containing sensor histidine kinase [Paracoccus siganidrum]RJL01843.1 sensor histidine kinase [Paracoccus siganidrum]RMC31135.1 sensor histidine kinase [Paracoccus siganidrum]